MPYDREHFFASVREGLFGGKLTQPQVDGMEYLLKTWEKLFEKEAGDDSTNWLAYCLATSHHESAFLHAPIEEYGRGEGQPYGEPAGPYHQCYYGRGLVQLTWLANYQKGEAILKDNYDLEVPMVQYPHRMLEYEPSAIILFDGMRGGWYTGVGLPQFFDADKGVEDAVNARKIVNGLDHAEQIAEYYDAFMDALVQR